MISWAQITSSFDVDFSVPWPPESKAQINALYNVALAS